jgi:hypothetical protein
MTFPDPPQKTVDDLARELWEAHGAHHEQLTRLAAPPFDDLDGWMQNHWRMLARVALAFIAQNPAARENEAGCGPR